MSENTKKVAGQSSESAANFNHLSAIGVRVVKPFVPPEKKSFTNPAQSGSVRPAERSGRGDGLQGG